MTNRRYDLPPLRDLPSGRLDQRAAHLLSEIAAERQRAGWRRSLIWRHAAPRFRPVPVAAAVAAVALVVVGVVLATRLGTTTASAAQVRAKLAQGLALAESIRGEYTVRARPPEPVAPYRGHGLFHCTGCAPVAPAPSRFVLGTDGSYAVRILPRTASVRFDVATNARTSVQTSYQQGYVRGLRLYVRGLHADPTWRYIPEYELSAWVRQAVAAHDPHVKNVTFDGRRAWQLTLVFKPEDDFYVQTGIARIDAIVDRDTGLVLQVTRYAGNPNWWSSIETVHNLTLGTPTSPADFVIAPPAGARVVVHDFGFHPISPTRAAALLGYRPLLPTATGGRVLTAFAVAKVNSLRLLPNGPGPVYRDVASARYAVGPNSITVSTRRGSPTDLLPLFEGMTSNTIHVTRGALAGAAVQLATSPPNAGYLAAYSNGLIIQLRAPSAREAVLAANSLRAAA